MIFQKIYSKYSIVFVLVLIFCSCKRKSTKENFDKFLSEVKFIETEHDFGILKEGEDATYTFEFLNMGNYPVIIKEVRSSCGCTVPNYDEKPIKPGKKGKINIKYDTKRIGKFYKTIIVYLNAINSPITLIIKGEVSSQEKAAAKN